MSYELFIAVYFVLNSFVAGFDTHDKFGYDQQKSRRKKNIAIVQVVTLFLLGCFIYATLFIAMALLWLIQKVITAIQFLFAHKPFHQWKNS